MSRNFFKGTRGDPANAALAAASYNLRRLLAWLAALWRVFITMVLSHEATVDDPMSTNAAM